MTNEKFLAEMRWLNDSDWSKEEICARLQFIEWAGCPCPNLKEIINAHSPRYRINRALQKGATVEDFGLTDEDLSEKYGLDVATLKLRRGRGVSYDAPRNFGSGSKKGDRAGIVPTKTCPQCQVLIPTGCFTCPHCQHEMIKRWFDK